MLADFAIALPFSGLDWLPIVLGIAAAYVVFGIAGFARRWWQARC